MKNKIVEKLNSEKFLNKSDWKKDDIYIESIKDNVIDVSLTNYKFDAQTLHTTITIEPTIVNNMTKLNAYNIYCIQRGIEFNEEEYASKLIAETFTEEELKTIEKIEEELREFKFKVILKNKIK